MYQCASKRRPNSLSKRNNNQTNKIYLSKFALVGILFYKEGSR